MTVSKELGIVVEEGEESARCARCHEAIEPYSEAVDVCEGEQDREGHVVYPSAVSQYHRPCYRQVSGEADEVESDFDYGPRRRRNGIAMEVM